jgi:N12 class adenine-specific DNA methylase
MGFIAEALGLTHDQVEADLAGAIFLNPESRLWETADAYLSGPVRTKLKAALAAAETEPRFAANVEALQAAQPTDLKPSEITARLGAPWIPPADIAAFCREIIGIETQVRHLSGIGTWNSATRFKFFMWPVIREILRNFRHSVQFLWCDAERIRSIPAAHPKYTLAISVGMM